MKLFLSLKILTDEGSVNISTILNFFFYIYGIDGKTESAPSKNFFPPLRDKHRNYLGQGSTERKTY